MDAAAKQFRESRLKLLEFFASPAEQLEWQQRTPSLDSSEFMCWWLDDFVPDSALFKAAFRADEIRLIQQFHDTFEQASALYPAKCPSANDLQRDPEWQLVIECARRTRERMQDAI